MTGLKKRILALFDPKREVVQETPADQTAEERQQVRESLQRIQGEIEVISRQFGRRDT